MRESPCSHNIDDFKQRYNNTYGWLVDDQKKTLIRIHTVTGREVHFETLSGKGFFAYVDAGVVFEFLPITRGWFRTKDHGPVLLQRVPARQYSRGISRTNTAVLVSGYGGLSPITPDLQLLHDVFVCQVPEDFDAFLKGARPSLIINRYFLLTSKRVYCYGVDIGTYQGAVITLNDNLFAQELNDSITRAGYALSVKVAE